MIPVSEVWADVKKLNGNCDETLAYQKLNDAVELLANKSDWDPLVGYMDITCEERTVTLPREIETPIAVSYGDYPALPRGELFRFHLNGPGDQDQTGSFRFWQADREAVVYREFCDPTQVVLSAAESDDAGQIVWVYGFDEDRNIVRTEQNGVWVDGYPFTAATSPTLDVSSPFFSEITRIRKPVTAGPLKLWTVDEAAAADELLGIYSWDDTEPRFRRLRVDRAADLVRIHYRRRNFKLRTQNDLIPLHSRQAIVMMVRSLKHYDNSNFELATACEATAVRWLTEEQFTRNASIADPIQIIGVPMSDDAEIN
jgi:hypothetical protein